MTKEPLRSKDYVSFVSENVMLYGNFTAFQNLDYFCRLAGKRKLTKADYSRALESVGLQTDAFNTRTRTYSKGMRQKLGLAIALLKDAPNIILDEPTSGLDPKSGQEFLDLLMKMRNQGKSVFMSTHDIFRAKLMADRIGFIIRTLQAPCTWSALPAPIPRTEFPACPTSRRPATKPASSSSRASLPRAGPFVPATGRSALAGVLSCYRPGGMVSGRDAFIGYSPYVRPMLIGGVKCVLVDERLRDVERMAFDFVMNFAKDNVLPVVEACALPDGSPVPVR